VIGLVGMEGQKAHQVQCVCVMGIRCMRLLAAELSIEVSSGMHMGKAGLVECYRVACIRLIRCLGVTSGRTFAN